MCGPILFCIRFSFRENKFCKGKHILKREKKFYPCLKILVWKKGDSSFTLNSGAVSGRVLFPIRQSTKSQCFQTRRDIWNGKTKKLDRRIWVILLSLVLFIGGFSTACYSETSGGTVKVDRIDFVTDEGYRMSAKLYVPQTATEDSQPPAFWLCPAEMPVWRI